MSDRANVKTSALTLPRFDRLR